MIDLVCLYSLSRGSTPLIQVTLDLQHMLFTLTFDGKLLNCPVTSPRRVLDAGTGTGVWAIDYGKFSS